MSKGLVCDEAQKGVDVVRLEREGFDPRGHSVLLSGKSLWIDRHEPISCCDNTIVIKKEPPSQRLRGKGLVVEAFEFPLEVGSSVVVRLG